MKNQYTLLFGSNCISNAEKSFESVAAYKPGLVGQGVRFVAGWYPGFIKQIVSLNPGVKLVKIADFDKEASPIMDEYRAYAWANQIVGSSQEMLPKQPPSDLKDPKFGCAED
jgi:hypothetical protein